MIKRKRLLIPVTIQFSVRYIIRSKVLAGLQEFCDPVLILNWKDEELENELRARKVEFHYFPQSTFGKYFSYITKINGLKYARRIKSASTLIDKRRVSFLSGSRKQSVKKRLLDSLLTLVSYLLPAQVLSRSENMYTKKGTNYDENLQLLKQLQIDGVLTLTPFLKDEFLLLKCFAALQLPLFYSVLSFDNLTTRGYLPVKFNRFLVWNTLNKNEVLRIFGNDTNVEIVGPVQFDFYWDDQYIWTKEKWKKELKIETDRPLILFGGGHYNIVPNEPDWLLDIDKAISGGLIINDPVILFRRHPLDPVERWTSVLLQCNHVITDDPWKSNDANLSKTNITQYDLAKLGSTLKWTDVHVNASSTLTLDGAIFDKPQIGPAYTGNSQLAGILKDLYFREHFLPITQSGGLQVAYTKKELFTFLNEALSTPGKYTVQRKAMVDIFCEGKFGESAVRLVNALRKSLLN